MVIGIVIGMLALFIVGGGLLAFAFDPPQDYVQSLAADSTTPEPVAVTVPAKAPALVFFQPVGWSASMHEASTEQIVAELERHLREERQAAAAFFHTARSLAD